MRLPASAAIALGVAFCGAPETTIVAAHAAAIAAPAVEAIEGRIRLVGGAADLAALDVRINGERVRIAHDGTVSGEIAAADLYRLTVRGAAIFDVVATFAASEIATADSRIVLPAVEAVVRAPGRTELFFGGDVMMGRRFEAPLDKEPAVIRKASRAADMARLLDPMKPYFAGADLASVNLETVLATRDLGNSPGKSVVFYTHSDAARALADAGVDYVTLGNNHVYDYVEPGLVSTLAALDAAKLPWSGAGRDEAEALRAARLAAGGRAWSMLGFVGWKGKVEPNQVAEDAKGGAALGSDANIATAVRREVAAGRTPIVQYHGSTEYSDRPTAISERRMKLAIDSGAALVIAHHPHVAHGIELYKGRLIAYSLGNFIFDQSFPETQTSFVMRVWMDGDRLFRAELIPTQILDYRPVPAVGGMRQAALRRIIDLSAERGTRIGLVGGHGVIQPSAALAAPRRCPKDAGSQLNLFRYDLHRPEAACAGGGVPGGRDLLPRGDFEGARFGEARDRSWSVEGGTIDFDRDAHSGAAALALEVPGAGTATIGPKTFFRPVAERRLTFSGWIKLDANATIELLVQEQRKGSGRASALANAPRLSAGTRRIESGSWQPFRFEIDRGADATAQPLRPLLRINGASRAMFDDLALIVWGDAPGQAMDRARKREGSNHMTSKGRKTMDIRIMSRTAFGTTALALALASSAVLAASPFQATEVAAAAPVEGITATAWAIADAETGKVLASHELERPSNIASVTKLMTVLVIAEMAAADPAILDEELTFSERAVSIKGTKTGLEAGERVSVRDALYGLMLPSGNDAGYMFAIHFGPRLAGIEPPENPSVSYRAFVAAMNRKAKALGMMQTRYSSAFGDALNPETRTSSARDQLILAGVAMANPLVRQIVGTRDHEAKVRTATGGERSVAWHNTNELLGRAGVTGIKTGTNRSAGACLLTEVSVKGHRYHVVVLGSRTSADRYNDALKLLASATGRK